jgi:hypothetical protein
MEHLEESDSAQISLEEIYQNLIVHGELIVTIRIADVSGFKNSLAVHKSRLTKKMAAEGMPMEPANLSYVQVDRNQNGEAATVCDLHIILTPVKAAGSKVLAIRLPDNNL